MSRITLFVCLLMVVGAVISVDLPAAPKPGEHGQHGQHGQPDLKHPIDMHKQHDPAMPHDPSMQHESPKIPDPKDVKNFQDMQGQAKN